jgi:hypothetical protein
MPGTTSSARSKPTSIGRAETMRSTASALAASMRAAVSAPASESSARITSG